MPATVYELYGRRMKKGRRTWYERLYYITGADDEDEAYNALDTEAPAMLNGVPRGDDPDVDEIPGESGNYNGKVTWEEANAGSSTSTDGNMPPEGSSQFNFEISATAQKLTVSLDTGNCYDSEGAGSLGINVPDFGGLINVKKSGNNLTAEGVDVVAPDFGFGETHIKTGVDQTYITLLSTLVGKVNLDTFRGHEQGEVLFVGCRGTKKGQTKWEISYSFKVSKNADDIALRLWDLTDDELDEITVSKLGWEYLWVYAMPVEQNLTTSGVGKVHTSVPVYAYIEQVYDFADYAFIDIPE